MAIRQVTQLNAGKKTAGVDGMKCLSFSQRLELEKLLKDQARAWSHSRLRSIPIPKKDGTTRMLKIPTMKDRAWQCLIKYVIEPAHEALFHERSYGFRPGRETHDCQKNLYLALRSFCHGKDKRIMELDIEKCFDRIDHNHLMKQTIAPQCVKLGLWKCLKAGVNPEFPSQGTPQGGVVSPVLANIALDGIENIHYSVRYADDMVFRLKPGDDADVILQQVKEFLAHRGLNIKASKTKLVASTDGFDFLGWHFKAQRNGKLRCVPSVDNYQAFRQKVKHVVNNYNYGAVVKAQKLSNLVRGWRNYHRYCRLSGSRFSLYFLTHRAWKVFAKEQKLNRYQVDDLIDKAFPCVPYREHNHVKVKGDLSPFDGDVTYWSERNSKYYDGPLAAALKRQQHTCGHCGLKLTGGEIVQLHHIDGNHDNWKRKNLTAVHKSCHNYIHMSKSLD